MILKTYNVTNDFSSGVLISQLHYEIQANGSVTNFLGITKFGDSVSINGDSMNEINLDAAIVAHTPNLTQVYIHNTVIENKAFADDMMQRMKERNILEGLSGIDQAAWVHHRFRKTDYVLDDGPTVQIDVLNLVVSGDIETAEHVLGQMLPDDMTEVYHWLTQDRLDWMRNEIRAFLGWPPL